MDTRSSLAEPHDETQRRLEERFLAAYRRGESLKSWIERYPQHARDLAELAVAVDLQRHTPAPAASEVKAAHTALLKARQERPLSPPVQPVLDLAARARAVGLPVPQLAKRLQLSPELLRKLGHGYIRLETVPRRLLEHVAGALQTTADDLLAGLPRTPAMAGGMAFYTRDKPQAAQQQSFAEALAQDRTLAPAEKARWLAAAREEGLAE